MGEYGVIDNVVDRLLLWLEHLRSSNHLGKPTTNNWESDLILHFKNELKKWESFIINDNVPMNEENF